MRNDWFHIFLLVLLAYVTINAQSNQTGIGTISTGNATGNATDDDDDDEEPEPHRDLRCYSCNWNITEACGDPFDRNDKNVRVATCPNHTLCYAGIQFNWFTRTVLAGSRGCIYDADGPKDRWKYFHFYCDFDLCNGTIRALEFVPFVLLPIFFLRYPPTNILR